ncbi:MAG: phospholipid carrier-dependent glycosyltransferase [Fuerstiella sp.]
MTARRYADIVIAVYCEADACGRSTRTDTSTFRQMTPRLNRHTLYRSLLAVIVLSAMILIGWLGWTSGPNPDEVGHLPAGCLCVEFGNFDLYEVNPPLVKSIAALPVVLAGPEYNWSRFSDLPGQRTEWAVGSSFISTNGMKSFRYFAWARWALLTIWLLGTAVIARWAWEISGPAGSLAAVFAWCYCPEVMHWSATICPDSAAASMGVLSVYTFRNWLHDGELRSACLAGIAAGLAILTKTTWLILIPLLPILTVLRHKLPIRLRILHLLLMSILALYVINSGYAFTRSFTPLKDFAFFSTALAGPDENGNLRKRQETYAGNRFADHWLGELPVPLPASFVEGIDLQKYDFEEGKRSFLLGEYKDTGWWYWYLYALLVKTPLGLLLLFLLAGLMWAGGQLRQSSAAPELLSSDDANKKLPPESNQRRPPPLKRWQETVILLLPAITILTLVSSQTGFTRYLRYLLPCYPFAFIWLSQFFSPQLNPRPWLRRTGWGLLFWSAASGLQVFPHTLSYFNEAVGGPPNGHNHLRGVSIDWGQDLLRVGEWCREHPEAQPLYVAVDSFFDPEVMGVESDYPPDLTTNDGTPNAETKPPPGWYIISINRLHGPHDRYNYLHRYEPVERIGYSTFIYDLTEKTPR